MYQHYFQVINAQEMSQFCGKGVDPYPCCHNPDNNTTQPQHCSWVGHENGCANPTTTTAHPPPPPQQQRQQQRLQQNKLKKMGL